jgi:hypothetical protein
VYLALRSEKLEVG